jgi:hypothetical protein
LVMCGYQVREWMLHDEMCCRVLEIIDVAGKRLVTAGFVTNGRAHRQHASHR